MDTRKSLHTQPFENSRLYLNS